MVSLPDFDPNDPVDALKPDRLNRMSAGVYELGSVFKSFTFAMALDTGTVTLDDRIDATHAIRVGRFTIDDFHAKHRVLTVPEVFIYSSNIGAARMALKVGHGRPAGLSRSPRPHPQGQDRPAGGGAADGAEEVVGTHLDDGRLRPRHRRRRRCRWRSPMRR